MSEILLRIVDGARVVLYRHDPKNHAENVPTRYDLFRYEGGYGWGYSGSGANSLSFAIAGKISEHENLTNSQIADRARRILDGVVSKLDGEKEHTLLVAPLKEI